MDMIIILAAITAFISLGLLVSDVRFNEKEKITMNDLIEKVNQWFFDRDLAEGDGLGQLQKLHEEIYELAEARQFDLCAGLICSEEDD